MDPVVLKKKFSPDSRRLNKVLISFPQIVFNDLGGQIAVVSYLVEVRPTVRQCFKRWAKVCDLINKLGVRNA